MKNWLKNLLFVIFSFVFLGIGILVANIFIYEKGNPLKDPNFLVDNSIDSTTSTSLLSIDSTNDYRKNIVPESVAKKQPIEESSINSSKQLRDYDVVVGIFGELPNASRQLKKLKNLGFDKAYSYSKSSLTVISAGQFTRTEAQRIALDLHNQGFDAMVKHR